MAAGEEGTTVRLTALRRGGAAAELAAGGVDVGAAGAAEVGDEFVLAEDRGEGFGGVVGGGLVGVALQAEAGGVVAEEVHMHAACANDGGERAGVVGRIVYAAEEAILDRDGAAAAGLKAVGGGEDVGDRETFAHREELGARGVVGSVERDGEVDVETGGGEGVDAGDDADGGDGDLAPAEGAEAVVGDAVDRGEDVVEVQQGLAHAHEDEGLEAAADGEGFATEGEKLFDDFAGGEVALEAGLGGGAEIAAHGAADLGGNAAGGAVGAEIGHEHGLDGAGVSEAEEKFGGAVGGDLAGGEGGGGGGAESGELRAERGDGEGLEFFGEAGGEAEVFGGVFPLRAAARRVEGAEDAGGVGGFVAPGQELMLEFGEGVVGEGGGHAGSHAGRRGDAKRAGGERDRAGRGVRWWQKRRREFVT